MTIPLNLKQLLRRMLALLIYAPVLLWAISAGGLLTTIAASLVAAICAFEFYRMMAQHGHRPFVLTGILITLILTLSASIQREVLLLGLVVALILWVLGLGWQRVQTNQAVTTARSYTTADVSISFAGVLYLGLPMGHLLLLRDLPGGRDLALLVGLAGIACDSSAYLVGKYMGRHLLAPDISPRKTWEGATAGVIASAVVGTVLALAIPLPFSHGLALGVTIGIAVVLGDLLESKIKRYAGVKDSGHWIPENGGLLDVIDGYLIALPCAYYTVLTMGIGASAN